MKIINEWLSKIELNYVSEPNVTETFSWCSFSFTINNHSTVQPISDELCKLFNTQLNNYEDAIKFVFSLDGESFIFSNKSSDDIKTKLDKLNYSLSFYQEDEAPNITLKIEINKKSQDINIYSIEHFFNYLKEQKPFKLNSTLSENFKRTETSTIYFLVHDDIEPFNTNLFYFIPYSCKEICTKTTSQENYNYVVESRNRVSHFANASDWPFLPEDFKFHQDNVHEGISVTFSTLHNIYLLAFLCNMSSINNDRIECTLNGYTTIKNSYLFSDLKSINGDNLTDLYEWVYSINATDKLGIARQVIPLHIKNNDLFSINSGGLTSAESNFALFQRDNVKSYIEITNKLAEQVASSSHRAGEIAKDIASSMKTVVVGALSFFTSVFLLRTMLKNVSIKEVFTDDMVSISIVVLIIFCIIFVVSIIESLINQNHFKKSYESLKNIYSKVLTGEDIDEILDSDKKHKQDLKFINMKRYLYCGIFTLSVISTICAFNIFMS